MNVPIDHGIHRAIDLYGLGETAHQGALVRRYHQVRQSSDRLCQPLMTEDYVIQAMPDVSPPKWHLAHTSWFFETFIVALASPRYTSPHASYAYLFNSYYVAAGERHCRPKRGQSHRQPLKRSIAIQAMWTRQRTAFLKV